MVHWLRWFKIPIVVGFGTAFFTRQQAKTSEANAENQQQEELLRTYFDKMSELVLNSELSTNLNVQSIVRARTLAALHILNATRKGIVFRFLHDSNLLQHIKSYLYLLDLSNTDLIRIDLRKADLYKADLYKADLREADLREADLRGADLYGADLRGANLERAKLEGATATSEQFIEAKNVTPEQLAQITPSMPRVTSKLAAQQEAKTEQTSTILAQPEIMPDQTSQEAEQKEDQQPKQDADASH